LVRATKQVLGYYDNTLSVLSSESQVLLY